MPDPNVYDPQWETPPDAPRKGVRLGRAAGAQELGLSMYELAPGAAISPYHLHHANEEMLVVLSGRPLLRTPDGYRSLEPGAVVAFPRGADGAHRVSNPSAEEDVRVLLISTMRYPEVADYPATGSRLTLTAPGEGKAHSADGEVPWLENLTETMRLDALDEAQRGTSTS
jgi:uncharacterized cupin superfamily protein